MNCSAAIRVASEGGNLKDIPIIARVCSAYTLVIIFLLGESDGRVSETSRSKPHQVVRLQGTICRLPGSN